VYVDAGAGLAVDGDIKFTNTSRINSTNSSTQTIAFGGLIVPQFRLLDFDTTNYDNLGEFDLTSNRFTATYSGYYNFEYRGVLYYPLAGHIVFNGYTALFDSNSTRHDICSWYQAGVVSSLTEFIVMGNKYDMSGTKTIYLEAGDWVEIKVAAYAQDDTNTAMDAELDESEIIINRIV